MEKIYILLPVHNRKEVTHSFIDCLISQRFTNYHLILIDDGSTDGTAEMVKHLVKDVTIIRGQGNWWWAGCLHKGYQWLQQNTIRNSDIVLIINDDTNFSEDFLEIAANTFTNKKHILISSHVYSLQTRQIIDVGVSIDWQNRKMSMTKEESLTNCLSTRALFLRWEDFKFIGGFRPKLLPHHAADYEFTSRAIRKGVKVVFNPLLKIYVNELTTGYNSINAEYGLHLIRKIFSRKSSLNPIPITIFLCLSCPWKWKIQYIISVWKTTLVVILKNLFYTHSP